MSVGFLEAIQNKCLKIKNAYSHNQRTLKRLHKTIGKIAAFEEELITLSNEDLQAKTPLFKERLAQGESLNALLPEAFAVVREASRRVLGMRHFDVQMMGGIVLHEGKIAEMKTGEGKTLVSTAPVYLNALLGKGVHVVTVNDYLAQRDADHLSPLYTFLGLSVGCVTSNMSNAYKKAAYDADITYGTNNEFGFDYLRDNMKTQRSAMYQRELSFAIVDEVDSILIDEARTPLIISGPSDDSSELYNQIDVLVAQLTPEDYEKDEKHKSIAFTEQGLLKVEEMTKSAGLTRGEHLFQSQNISLVHHLNQALKARFSFEKDVDYIVHNGQVIIIDEFTGRMKKGNRYSEGLHQALEAKEGVEIEPENQTLASITFQNYFLMYKKLSGMTGTAETEKQEFNNTYHLPVVVIPTNKPITRKDLDDEIFATFQGKVKAVVKLIQDCQARQQPVLLGTASIEKSEVFSNALRHAGIPHHVLNARQHDREATIIAKAGMPGAVTIATNMAGRGTDIQLGGNLGMELSWALEDIEDPDARSAMEEEVRQKVAQQKAIAIKAGGLYVIGTERHENRRIDNQLRGRSGRQGDPGGSKFYISLEDELMRIFGPRVDLLKRMFLKGNEDDSEPITHPWLTRNIEKAQARVEAQHFDMRKNLLKYAKVLNDQRISVYDERTEIMSGDPLEKVVAMQSDVVHTLVSHFTDPKKMPDFWDIDQLNQALERIFSLSVPIHQWVEEAILSPDLLAEKLEGLVLEKWQEKIKDIDVDLLHRLCYQSLLKTLDREWVDHLNAMEHLRNGIHLQSYGQKNPLNEYKQEAFTLFRMAIVRWKEVALTDLYRMDFQALLEEDDDDGAFPDELLDFFKDLQARHDEQESLEEEDLRSLSSLDSSEDEERSSDDEEDELWEEEEENEEEDPEALTLSPDRTLEGRETRQDTESKREKRGSQAKGKKESEEKEWDADAVSRNALCPCGSGKRFKSCHGRITV